MKFQKKKKKKKKKNIYIRIGHANKTRNAGIASSGTPKPNVGSFCCLYRFSSLIPQHNLTHYHIPPHPQHIFYNTSFQLYALHLHYYARSSIKIFLLFHIALINFLHASASHPVIHLQTAIFVLSTYPTY